MSSRMRGFVGSLSVVGLVVIGVGAQDAWFDGRAGDALGTSIAGVGDVDGDGVDDLLFGAPGEGVGGVARVVSGRDHTVLHEFVGLPGAAMGRRVAAAGDVDRDGHADLLIERRADTSSARVAVVHSGASGALLHTFVSNVTATLAIAGAGDVDGDGRDDVVIGGADRAQVFSGRDGALLHTLGPFDATFGSSVGGAGDTNGDGCADVIVGAPLEGDINNPWRGSARVFSGADGTVLRTFSGGVQLGRFGVSVNGAGDVNGDGFADVIVGSESVSGSGCAYVYSGATGTQLHSKCGSQTLEQFGTAVAPAGDIDRDGLADFAVAAPSEPGGFGQPGYVRVFSGATGAVIAEFNGEKDHQFGESIGFADLECDGVLDLIVGVPGFDEVAAGGGRVEVYLFDSYDRHAAAAPLLGASAGDQYGRAVSGAGDVNGDGFADVIVGAPSFGASDAGRATVVSGADRSVLHTFDGASGDFLGWAVDGAGDVDGDGLADVIVGSPNFGADDVGRAQVFSGADGSVLHTFTGTAAQGLLGFAARGAGDVNADGFADLVVGAWGEGTSVPAEGTVRVYSGVDGAVLWTWSGEAAGDQFGFAIDGLGDANADGFADVIVGARIHDGLRGKVYAYSGKDGSELFSAIGTAPGEQFGFAVGGAGDVDGDGRPDAIVGAPYWHNGVSQPVGRATLLSGASGLVLWAHVGTENGEEFGWSVGGAGDAEGDGRADYLVGAPNRGAGGRVRVFSGQTQAVLAEIDGAAPGVLCGFAAAAAGDVNRDGFADVIVGCNGDDAGGLDAGSAVLLLSQVADRGKVQTFGPACAGGNGNLPRIDLDPTGGLPVIGGTYRLTLASAPTNAPTALHIGTAPTAIDLVIIGFPDCILLTLPLSAPQTVTSAAGAASRNLSVPSSQVFVGVPFYYQWVVLDFPASTVALSNGAKIVFGVP